jgi:serine/threonine-protein kinase RsbW
MLWPKTMSEASLPSVEFDGLRLITRLDREIPGRYEEIGPVVDEVLTTARSMGCAVGKEFEIEVALREALSNAIRHGCADDPAKRVQLTVACDEERGMLIVVRDFGKGFDPADIPNPVVGQNIYSNHGRGIFLINRLMDEVRFDRGGTEIRMRKR